MKQLTFFILIFPILCQAQSTRAWFADYSLEPKLDTFSGIEIGDMGDDLKAIDILNCGDRLTFTESQCEDISLSNVELEFEGDFNNNGKLEIWNVGVAKTKEGKYRRILIARDKNSGELLQVLKLKSYKQNFSAVSKFNGFLTWWMCMNCGHGATVRWNGEEWYLDWGNAGDWSV